MNPVEGSSECIRPHNGNPREDDGNVPCFGQGDMNVEQGKDENLSDDSDDNPGQDIDEAFKQTHVAGLALHRDIASCLAGLGFSMKKSGCL